MTAAQREPEVRELGERDVVAFRDLRARALSEHPEWFGKPYETFVGLPMENVARSMSSPRAFTIGAFDGDSLVGIARCSYEPGAKDAHKALVTSVYVAPEARGRGIGKSLMKTLIAAAARWPGVEELRLAVVVDNVGARQLYRDLGFKVWGIEPRSMKIGDKYVDEEHMYLILGHREAS
ncbi:MAG: GNAT family N-acetyltransferase [Chloroflexi bacterium]|nr:GNAT family N-acetyltransferase [Chloroflexota bacterium]